MSVEKPGGRAQSGGGPSVFKNGSQVVVAFGKLASPLAKG